MEDYTVRTLNINRQQYLINIPSQAKFVRDSSMFSISLVLAGLCGIIRSFFLAKFLGPEAFGTWRFVNIFAEYLHFTSLGTQPAMRRSIPFLRGKGDAKTLHIVSSTVCATTFYTSILYSVVLLTWSFFLTEASTAKALAAFSPVALLLAWLNFTFGFSMAIGLYRFRSSLEVAYAISTLLLSIMLVYRWGVYGAIAGLGFSALITVAFSAFKLWEYLALNIEWEVLWKLMLMGIPITIDIMLPITMANADRILIAAMLSRETLGIYSVASAGVSILGTIPSAVGQILFVKFAEMDGQNKTNGYMSNVLDKTTVILSTMLAFLISTAIACFPITVILLLPDYVGGISAGKLLISSIFFLGVSLPVSKWCISTGRYVPVLALRSIVIVVEFVVVYFSIRNGASLEFIAFIVLCAFALFSIMIFVACNYLLDNPLRKGLVSGYKSFLPFLSILSVLLMQDYVCPIDPYTTVKQLLSSSILGLLVSLTISLLFIFWVNRSTHVFKLIFQRKP